MWSDAIQQMGIKDMVWLWTEGRRVNRLFRNEIERVFMKKWFPNVPFHIIIEDGN